MLSVSKISDAGAAHHYFSEADDYYLRDRESSSAAQWYGAGAERAGLTGEVQPRDFKDVLEGRIGGAQIGHPDRHTPGWDATFSASKSVSIAALVRGDRRLIDAHDRAVREALDVLQQHSAMTRQRAGAGGYEYHQTGNLTAAVFRHASNREQEPQLHSHSVIANATYDERAGKWVSLWTRDGLYRAQREANAVYTNALAREARALGYHVEWSVNEQGHPSFELAEIDPATRELFSGRTAAIDAELARHGLTRATASPEQKQAATLATRRAKEHVPGAELSRRWREQAAAHGADLQRPDPAPELRDAVAEAREAQAADAAVAQATKQLAEREARFTPRELALEARVYSQGRAGEQALAAAVDRARSRGNLIDRKVAIRAPGGERVEVAGYTTESGEKVEHSMLQHSQTIAVAGRDGPRIGEGEGRENTPDAVDDRIRVAEQQAGFQFTEEHHQAVHGILEQRGGLSILQGHAGTAKTTAVLAVVADHAREGGWKVRAMAPTSSAAQTLGEAIDAEPKTVAAVIQGRQRDGERSAERELWIVDEAGMLSARDTDALLARAEREGARVVLAGDNRQIGSVGAGRAFWQLQNEHPESVYELRDIRRQRSEELRSAIYDALDGRAGDALGKVDVREESDRKAAADLIARQYMDSTGEGRETLVVTLSRQDRADVNAAIQRRREAAGDVHDVQPVRTLSDRQWTDAERADAARYQPGDVIQANRDFAHLARGETATVTGVADGRVTVQRADGEAWTLDPRRVSAYAVLRAEETRIGAGDRVVAKGAVRATDAAGEVMQLKNGTELDVTDVTPDRLTARDRAGREYEIDTREGVRLDLSYAQTANQAQGKTVDAVIGYMRSSQTNLADQQRVYVTLSRARDSATIVTDDRAALAETIARNSGEKDTALEPEPERGPKREPDRDRAAAPAADRDAPEPARGTARDRALGMLREMDAETHRMAAQGERNLRQWAAERRAETVVATRQAERDDRLREGLADVDRRERAQVKAHKQREGYSIAPPSLRALRDRWAIERHAREDRRRLELEYQGKGDSRESRKLDARRERDLRRELIAVRKRTRELQQRNRAAHGPLDVRRYSQQRRIERAGAKAEAGIVAQLQWVQTRIAARHGRDVAAKARALESARDQRAAQKAAQQAAQARAAIVPIIPGRGRVR